MDFFLTLTKIYLFKRAGSVRFSFFLRKGVLMSLLKTLWSVLDCWRPAFCKEQAFTRAKEHAIAALCSFGRRTITNFAILLGRDDDVPTADYKLYTEYKWNVEDLFNPILEKCLKFTDEKYIVLAADDTKLKKTGKKIPKTSWQRDPMSPPFHTNFIWSLRFLQFSILLPLYKKNEGSCRSIPIRFIEAPCLKKPGKKASKQAHKEYKQLRKKQNLSTQFIKELEELRKTLDSLGASDKTLIMTVDGSYCNSTCMSANVPNTHLIARCRKDAKLCKRHEGIGKKFYSDKKFTPEEVRKDDSIPWEEGVFFYGGAHRKIRYKKVNSVLWQGGTKRKELTLIVIEPLPYVRGGKRNYRDPAYLLTTAIGFPIEDLIQAYFDHWQIEYNHRDEKSILGVGQAQVRNENSVGRQPGLHVAAYSAMLLSSIIAYNDQHTEEYHDIPGWREKPKRLTCRAMVGRLRASLIEDSEELNELKINIQKISSVLRKAA
jgi:hypothetical protein